MNRPFKRSKSTAFAQYKTGKARLKSCSRNQHKTSPVGGVFCCLWDGRCEPRQDMAIPCLAIGSVGAKRGPGSAGQSPSTRNPAPASFFLDMEGYQKGSVTRVFLLCGAQGTALGKVCSLGRGTLLRRWIYAAKRECKVWWWAESRSPEQGRYRYIWRRVMNS